MESGQYDIAAETPPHVPAALLKKWLRGLKVPLITPVGRNRETESFFLLPPCFSHHAIQLSSTFNSVITDLKKRVPL